MPTLNELEKTVLQQMLQVASDKLRPLLREQLDGVTVASRKNTGVGFFTDLKVENVAKRIDARVTGNVWADIEGFNQPMTFLLLLRDGIVQTLEGATIDDDTSGVDFSQVRFVIRPVFCER
jgi:hypothetical protein